MKRTIRLFTCLCLVLALVLSACEGEPKPWSEGPSDDYGFNYSQRVGNETTTAPSVTHYETTTQAQNLQQQETTTQQITPIVVAQEGPRFYYSQLPEEEQQVYQALVEGSAAYVADIPVPGCSQEQANRIVFAMTSDYPAYYWTGGAYVMHSMGGQVSSIEFTVPADAKDRVERSKARAEEIVAEAKAAVGEDPYELVKYYFETIVTSTNYIKSEHDQWMNNVLLEGNAVCAGYAKTFLYLCQLSGIECGYVTGHSKGESHAWNVVKLDDVWYWVDVTWGDPVSNNEKPGNNFINYNYLTFSDDFCFLNHTLALSDEDAAAGIYDPSKDFTYPTCADDGKEYYKAAGAYFASYSVDAVKEYLAKNVQEGKLTEIPLRFATATDYAQFNADFLSNGPVNNLRDALTMGDPSFETSGYQYSTLYFEDIYFLTISFEKT
ncbi:MAG: hypothetical protein IJ744_11870 [Lachnospiraceae bacterium]|nr:hypothetical protein [Lachnospiraceae bacterium]